MTKVPGKNNKHKVRIYTLSTCGWCKKTKALLKSLEVEYEYFDTDMMSAEEYEKASAEVRKHNPRETFPTIIIDDGKEVIVGFDEEKVRRCLADGKKG